jgi:hypothetical protein
MTRRLLLAAAAALAATALSSARYPAAASDDVTVAPTSEAWFQPNPTCTSPVGCVVPGAVALPVTVPAGVPTSPYPARTMHVGVAGGTESARTYLGFALSHMERAASAATLTVPLDVSPAAGTTSPETAKLQVCTTTSAVSPADGSLAAPPPAQCGSAAVVSYVALPTPHLEADLAPLLDRLSSAAGLVLLPDATTLTPTDAWQVAFSAHDRADPAAPGPATVRVTLSDTPSPEVTIPAAVEPAPAALEPSSPTPSALGPAADLAIASGEVPAVGPAVVGPVQPIAAQGLDEVVTLPYQYPAIWLLPLALLVLVPAAARALTKDLTPRLDPKEER